MFIWQSDQRVREAYSLIFLCGIIPSSHLWPWLIGPQSPDRTSRWPRSSLSPQHPWPSVWPFQPHTHTASAFSVSKSMVLHTQGEVEARHKLWLGTFRPLQGKGSRIIQKMALSLLAQEDPAPIIHCYLHIFSAYWTKCNNLKSALEITYNMERHWQNILLPTEKYIALSIQLLNYIYILLKQGFIKVNKLLRSQLSTGNCQ